MFAVGDVVAVAVLGVQGHQVTVTLDPDTVTQYDPCGPAGPCMPGGPWVRTGNNVTLRSLLPVSTLPLEGRAPGSGVSATFDLIAAAAFVDRELKSAGWPKTAILGLLIKYGGRP
jgi:hypothetical protein